MANLVFLPVADSIPFTRYFSRSKPLTLEEIRADILAVQKAAEGLMHEFVPGVTK